MRLFFALLVLMPVSALADARHDAFFTKMLSDPAYNKGVVRAASQTPVFLNNYCASAAFTPMTVAVYEPILYDDTGYVTQGVWNQSIEVMGCEAKRLLNVLVISDRKTKAFKVMPTLPGTTRADPQLQKDSMMFAHTAVARKGVECKDIYVADTAFKAFVGGAAKDAKGKPWDEMWTVMACGEVAEVQMHFIPDKTGTTIRTLRNKTKFKVKL